MQSEDLKKSVQYDEHTNRKEKHMDFRQMTIADIPVCPKTIVNAVDQAIKDKRILAEEEIYAMTGHQAYGNASTIQTAMIQIVGRFCEHHASDLIIHLAELQPFIQQECVPEWDDTQPHRWTMGMGLREMGVDGNAFIMDRIAETKSMYGYVHPNHVYRKVLALDIVDTRDDGGIKRCIRLVDISYSLYKIDPEDVHK